MTSITNYESVELPIEPEKENALIAIWERDFDKIKRRHNNRGLIF